MSIAFPRITSTIRPNDATPVPPVHWPSAFVGLFLAVLVVVSISWLAAPRREVRPLPPAAIATQATSSTAAPVQPAPPQVAPTPIPAPAIAEPEPPAAEKVRVANTNGSNLNLRAKAGEKAQRLKSVPEGSILEIVGEDRTADGIVWKHVRDAAGATGFVAGKFVVTVQP